MDFGADKNPKKLASELTSNPNEEVKNYENHFPQVFFLFKELNFDKFNSCQDLVGKR